MSSQGTKIDLKKVVMEAQDIFPDNKVITIENLKIWLHQYKIKYKRNNWALTLLSEMERDLL